MILLTPGPCMTSDSVRAAAAMPDMNHRDPAFIAILDDVKKRLRGVYPELAAEGAWRTYLIGGSGTAAVEAMITSCVKDGPVLLIDSGYYSGRMRAKLEAHEIPYTVFETDWLQPLSPPALERALNGGYEAVVTTHNETTTGRLHPLADIGALCQRSGAKLLVDAMSSFGADEIDFAGVDAIASSANKCLHGLPGLSFVLVRDRLAEQMQGYPRRTVYLNLPFYEGDSPPLTPPVPILTAFRQALMEVGPDGAAGRRREYRRRASIIRDGLLARGMRLAVPDLESSCAVTTASLPSGWSSEDWFQANLGAGYMIYGTKGVLRDQWFQVANMGELTDEHIRLWLANVDDLLMSG